MNRLFVFLLVACSIVLSSCAPNSGLLGGGSWQASNLQQRDIRALEADAKNPQLLYAGDTQGHIYVSDDGGQHWSQRNASLPGAIANLTSNGKQLYAATAQGLFVSSDTAEEWSNISATAHLPNGAYTTFTFDVNSPQVIYCGTEHHGVFRSENAGASWTPLNTGLPDTAAVRSLTLNSDQQQLWAATTLGIYRYNGTSWSEMSNGIPASTVVNAIVLAVSNGGPQGLVYAGTQRGLFLSQDDGAHWQASQESLAATQVLTLLIDFRSTRATTVYAGTAIGALRSDDSGQHWDVIAAGLPKGASVAAMTLGASNYSQLYAAANGIYLFPGNGSGLNADRLLPLVFFAFLFYLLYRGTTPRRRMQPPPSRRSQIPEPSPPRPPSEFS